MMALKLFASLCLVASLAFADNDAPPPSCPDPRAWHYLQNAYPRLDRPEPARFLALPPEAQEKECAAVHDALRKHDAAVPKLRAQAEKIGELYKAWLDAQSKRDAAASEIGSRKPCWIPKMAAL